MKRFIEKIDKYHLEDIKNKNHPAVYFKQPDYHLFIFRLPKQKDKNIIAISYPFIVIESKYFVYDRELNDFVEFLTVNEFHTFLDKLINDVLVTSHRFHIEIEKLEEKLYSGLRVHSFSAIWFTHKKNLIVFDRILLGSNDVMESFLENFSSKNFDLKNGFEDIGEHLQRAQRSSNHALEKLDAIYNFHQNIANEKMNQTIYLLTILSGIFLPLNLIVGFFGINTTSLPFTTQSGGSYSVLILLGVVFITSSLLLFYFKIKK